MRPQNQQARDRFGTILSRHAPAGAASLASALDVSISSIHRIAREHQHVIQQGITKNKKYALRRPLRGQTQAIPVYRIDAVGQGHHLGNLELIAPQGALLPLNNIGWPTEKKHQGWWDGLPYPLYDMRPQGFLGRHFAHHITQDLNVPENPERWSDDDIAHVLSLRGMDCIGDLIIGDTAYQRRPGMRGHPHIINEAALIAHYAQQATHANEQGHAGSSAGGEFPKFTSHRDLSNSKTPHVIVKYSGADTSSPVQRWSDLLICEHLALSTLAQHTNISAANSRILMGAGRTFLEVERFDRIGEWGRSPVISLDSLNNAFIGSSDDNWHTLTSQLATLGFTSQTIVEKTHIISWFGKLIANTDMHLGNLSFTFDYGTNEATSLKLSPVYDMLPMRYAPLSGGEVPTRDYSVLRPLPQEQQVWTIAAQAALAFWQTASQDIRISQPFRTICEENYQALQSML